MTEPTAGEVQACTNVGGLQVGKLLDDLFHSEAVRQKVEDVADPDTHAADAGSPAALLGVDGDPFVKKRHGINSEGHAKSILIITDDTGSAGWAPASPVEVGWVWTQIP
jgi:hypothetical protein